MATMPALHVPVIPDVILPDGLKCAFCADPKIRDGEPLDQVPDAVTFAATIQTFSLSGPQGMQEVAAPVSLPVCYDCRGKQLGGVSKTGLLTA